MNWMEFFRAAQGVFTFVLIGSLGFYLSRRNWFGEESTALLARLTTVVAIPLLLLHHLDASFGKSDLEKLSRGVTLPIFSHLIALVVAFALVRLAGIPRKRHGIFIASFAFSNTLNIGVPINLALFGDEAMPYILLYYLGSTIVFWSLGYYLLMRDMRSESVGMSLRKRLKNLMPPPMAAVLISLLLISLDMKLPAAIAGASRLVGNLVTPLVMIGIGIILSRMTLAQMRAGLDTWLIVAGRIVISPLIVVVLGRFFDLPELMLNVFIIQSSLPVMTTIAMLCHSHHGDAEYATKNITLTTLLAIATIPVSMMLINS